MSTTTQLALAAVRSVVGGACRAAGLADGGEKALAFLAERFSDHGQRVPKAVAAATDRAWKALELALAGESFWTRFDRAEDRTLAQELRLALVVVPWDDAIGDKAAFFRDCLAQLKAARRSGLAGAAPPTADELQRHRDAVAAYADPAALTAAAWHAADRLGERCEAEGHRQLAALLRLRAGEWPFLGVAVRYYFRRAVEEDRELFQGLAFAKLDALGTAQERQFAALAGTLDRHAALLGELLADVLAVAEQTRAGVLRIEDEMQRQGEADRAFYAAVIQRLDKLEMSGREVRPGDGMSIRTDDERQKVREFLRQYRAMPASDRRERPALLDAVAKLGFAAGDFEQAQADFQELPTLLDDKAAKAQAHHNAYRAALEAAGRSGTAEDWKSALLELVEAVKLDRRFMPFDGRKYAPSRILGAGGFGVTFLCKHKELDDFVAVKALLAEELEQDAAQVFAEGRVLRKIDHPAIIRMQDCGFADPDAQARPYLVMDFFDGQTLDALVAATGPLPLDDGLAVAKLLADGMNAAHGQGVLHRDLKPANVLVRTGPDGLRAKIIDFGLALKRETVEAVAGVRTSQRQKSLATSGIAGTVDYAAPEQMGKLAGVPVGTYSDVYGWGKTVCFALFKTPTPGSRHYKSKEVPDALRELLEACLDDEPPHRPQTFAEVLRRLAAIESERNPALELADDGPAQPAAKWYFARSGQRSGPVAEDALRAMLAAGTVGPDDVVWRDGMPGWVAARSVEGLVPKAATTGVKVRFFCRAEKASEPTKVFGLLPVGSNRDSLLRDVLKVYVDGKFHSEGNRLTGFDLTFEVGPGRHTLEVAWWNDNEERDRRQFQISFPRSGGYELRFNFVRDTDVRLFGTDVTHIKKSTVEVLKEPS